MKVHINKKRALIFSCIILITMFSLTSCQEEFKVYPVIFDLKEVDRKNTNLSIKEIDFRYLNKENKLFNEIIFELNPIDSASLINNGKRSETSMWINYKGTDYKIYQRFGSIYEMHKGQAFAVECTTESIGSEGELYLLFQDFDTYNQKNKIKVLKQELPKITLYRKVGERITTFSVTNETKAQYTKVPSSMKSIISINYD